jgi:hypothetical protein
MGGVFISAYHATAIYGSVTLPFVIPSEAEGSAVRPGSRTKVWVLLVLTQTLPGWADGLATGPTGLGPIRGLFSSSHTDSEGLGINPGDDLSAVRRGTQPGSPCSRPLF